MNIKQNFNLYFENKISLDELITRVKHSKQTAKSVRNIGRNDFYWVGEEAFLSLSPVNKDNLDYFVSNFIPDKFWKARNKYKKNFEFYNVKFEFYLNIKTPLAIPNRTEWLKRIHKEIILPVWQEKWEKINEKDINKIDLSRITIKLENHYQQEAEIIKQIWVKTNYSFSKIIK